MKPLYILLVLYFITACSSESSVENKSESAPVTSSDPSIENVKRLPAQEAPLPERRIEIALLDSITMDGTLVTLDELPDLLKKALLKDTEKAICISTRPSTSYEYYVSAHTAIEKAYRAIYEHEAKRSFHQPFDALSEAQQHDVKDAHPMTIIERMVE